MKDLVGYRPVVLSNVLYLIGGRDWNHGNLMAGVWRYDPRVNQWSEARPLSTARCRFTAEAVDGFIYVMGQLLVCLHFCVFMCVCVCMCVCLCVWRYDPRVNQWPALHRQVSLYCRGR